MNIHWALGQVLLPEHFRLGQQHLNQRFAAVLGGDVAAGVYGLLDLRLKQEHLLAERLEIQRFEYVLPNGTYLSSDVNTLCDRYSFELPDDGSSFGIFFAVDKEPQIEQTVFAEQAIPLEYYRVRFSDEEDQSALFSAKLLQLNYNEAQQQYSLNTPITEKLIRLPAIFSGGTLSRLMVHFKKLENQLEANRTLSLNKIELMRFELDKLRLGLDLQAQRIAAVAFDDFIKLVHQFYLVACLVYEVKAESIPLDVNHLKTIKILSDKIDTLMQGKVISKQDVIELRLDKGLYQTGILPSHFISSGKKYLLLEVHDVSTDLEKIKVKAFAPSRAKLAIFQAAAGLKMNRLTLDETKRSFRHADIAYAIDAQCDEWQYVQQEKNIMLKGYGVDANQLHVTLVKQ